MYGEMFMIFAEPGLEQQGSVMSSFEVESGGLRLATITIRPVEAVSITAGDGLVHEKRQWENQKL
jgi:hypothetical protein